MKKIQFKGYKIRIYTDPNEYANMPEKPFGDIPEGVVFKGVWDDEKKEWCDTAGFCTLEDKVIRLYVGEKCKFIDLLGTVSHESGHLIEGGFKKNPPSKDRYFKKHEQKAEHYENFTVDAYALTHKIFAVLGREFKDLN